MFKKLYENESGQSIVFVALMLTVLLGFGALAVDIGYMTFQRSSMQNAADAAALAGAVMVPTYDLTDSSDVDDLEEFTINYAESNFNFDGASYTITPNVVDQTLNVEINQEVPKFLSGIITNDIKTMSVSATAKYGYRWNGDALPFVNLDDTINIGDTVDLWEKLETSGDFENIWKDDFEYDETFNYFKIDFSDGGISITKGRKMDKADDVESVITPAYANNTTQTVYFFSLNPAYVGTLTSEELKNQAVIPLSKLILVEAYVTYFDFTNANEPVLKLKVKQTYDIYNGIIPTGYNSSFATAIAHLIK
jgi:Flp pilus assembly protein TadG